MWYVIAFYYYTDNGEMDIFGTIIKYSFNLGHILSNFTEIFTLISDESNNK